MPIETRPARPAHQHPELVAELSAELGKPRPKGPGIPQIIEQKLAYGNKMDVAVIWDKWADVGHEQRGPIILDAYREQRGDAAMLDIIRAMGFTPEEAKRLNIQ